MKWWTDVKLLFGVATVALVLLWFHAGFTEEVPRSASVSISFLNPHQCILTPFRFAERDRGGRVISYEWYRCLMPVRFDGGSGTGVIEVIHPNRRILQCLSDELKNPLVHSIYLEGYPRDNVPKGGYDSYPPEGHERLRQVMRQVTPPIIEFTAVRFFTAGDAADYEKWRKQRVAAGAVPDYSAWLKVRNRGDRWEHGLVTTKHCMGEFRGVK